MGKRNKQQRQPAKAEVSGQVEATSRTAFVADPPAKNPTLLAISLCLFVAWFLFLLVTALLNGSARPPAVGG